MTRESKKLRDEYFNLMNGLADSVFEMSDAEIDEVIADEGDNSDAIRAVLLNSIKLAKKQALVAAKEEYAAELHSFQKIRFELPPTSEGKRDLLQSMLGNMSQTQQQALTGQFRDFEELADEDLDGFLLQLIALQDQQGTDEKGE
jgi:hypothetical protein